MGVPETESRLLITSEALDQLAPEWTALHATIPRRTPFTHPEWHRTWLRHFGSGSVPVFLSFRHGEALVGVLALDMQREAARQLGDPNVCDYAGLLASPGREEDCAEGVIEWLNEDDTSTLQLWGTLHDEPATSAFTTAARRFGWALTELPEAVCPACNLPGDFGLFVASLPKHDRHELRRKLRNLASAGTVAFESVTAPAEVAAGMDAFLSFMRLSRDDKDEFLTPAMEAFFHDIATTFAVLGMARLSTLTLDGVAVAMLLGFENESTEFLYNSGYDPEYAHLAVGLLSKALAIEAAIGRGRERFDFLRGEEEYKRHLGGVPQQVVKFVIQRQ